MQFKYIDKYDFIFQINSVFGNLVETISWYQLL